MDLALLTHLCQDLVPLVDSGSKGGGFIGTASSSTSSSSSGSTTSSACLLRTQSNQESLMRSKLPGCTSRRLHSCCSCMLLHDSVQLRCPRHATSHRSIYRRGGTWRWLLTSSSCLLGRRVSWKELCSTPKVSRATAQASRLSPWVAALWFVLTLWAKKRQKMLTKNSTTKKLLNLSRHLVRKTGYEAGTGVPRLLSKASNTVFSRHNKTGCNLPVCTTNNFVVDFINDTCILKLQPDPGPNNFHHTKRTRMVAPGKPIFRTEISPDSDIRRIFIGKAVF